MSLFTKIQSTIVYPWTVFRRKMPLFSYITGRFFTMIFLLYVLGFALFGLMELAPGDIVDQMISQQIMAQSEGGRAVRKGGTTQDQGFTADQEKLLREELGLDKPFYVQYGSWLKRVVIHHDLGTSLISRAPVSFLIRSRIGKSVVYSLISLFFVTTFSFALGVYFSSKAGTKTDVAVSFVGLFFLAFPSMLLLILMQLFASVTGIFPVTAYPDFPMSDGFFRFCASYVHHIALPLLGGFLCSVGSTMRMIRSTMLDQIGMPYIMALRARGISERRVYFNHAFRNTVNPYITGSANLLASIFSGNLIFEIIFAYPGIGRLTYEAITQQDVNIVLADTMFISALVLVGMVVSDILLAVFDPRIRYGAES